MARLSKPGGRVLLPPERGSCAPMGLQMLLSLCQSRTSGNRLLLPTRRSSASTTSTEKPISGAPFFNSVAHGRCATESPPLNYFSVAHLVRAPQKVKISVAHRSWCATERPRLVSAYMFCGAPLPSAPQKYMRHKNFKQCATKM